MVRALTFLLPWNSPEHLLKSTGQCRAGINERLYILKPKCLMPHVMVCKTWTCVFLKGEEVRVQVQGSSWVGNEVTKLKGEGPRVTARKKNSSGEGWGRKAENLGPKGELRSWWSSGWVCLPGVTGSSHCTVRSFQCIQWLTAMGNSAKSWNPKPAMGKGWKSTPGSPGTISSREIPRGHSDNHRELES